MSLSGIVLEHRGIEHNDARRALYTVFNGDLNEFRAEQVKIAVMHTDANLGGHYHDYRELFYLLKGSAVFRLKDTDSAEQREVEIKEGDRLLIPPRVAHKAAVKGGSVLIGCTEKPYVSPAVNDIKYDF